MNVSEESLKTVHQVGLYRSTILETGRFFVFVIWGIKSG